MKNLFYTLAHDSDNSTYGTIKTALIIAIPICAVCFVCMSIISFWQRRRNKAPYPHDTEGGSIASRDPLIPGQIGGQTLKDLLDHTTSGSGSGMIMFDIFDDIP